MNDNDEFELDDMLLDGEEDIEYNVSEEGEEPETDENLEEMEQEREQEEQEIDYKVLYEKEQSKRKDLQNALNAERKQRKNKETLETDVYKDLVKQGVDSDVARAIANSIEDKANKSNSENADLKFEVALMKTSKKAGFEDIEDYSEEIRPFVDKGLTLEQAYYVAVGEKGKSINTKAEMRRQLEAKMKNQREKGSIQKVNTTAGGAGVKDSKYSRADLQSAQILGMPVEEFVAYKNIRTESDYQKFKNKKTA